MLDCLYELDMIQLMALSDDVTKKNVPGEKVERDSQTGN